ncbi:Alpha/Beta hydrolase protein [Thelonectria olida]|uniref:Alpha/Beta hydrolase protein n=1 Tax=Thelonectria olida TaxID=1576542 RepID=A0A9P8VXA1_9HYPO|nr:Alpha/Beta hydrolase protein [Thelonectria olida]
MTPEPENAWFMARGLKIAAHLYQPSPASPNRNGAAIIICHPWTSVKEQSPANYARPLTKAGFVCLAYDAAYQGESEGEPRNLEDPYQRVEEIKCAVTYLTSLTQVDREKIGVFGICAAGGYVAFATQTDLRIKACATVAAVCVGTMARRGFDQDSTNLKMLHAQLQKASRDRNSDVTGEKAELVYMLPESHEHLPDDYPESFGDLAHYYCTSRGFHPRATHKCIPRSWDLMANFDAFAFNSLISPRPLLMMTASKAVTVWFSEDAMQKAKEPKELSVIEGLTHADLYDKVDEACVKLVDFFGKNLA